MEWVQDFLSFYQPRQKERKIMIPLTEIFCVIDDFCKQFEQEASSYILPNPQRKRARACNMCLSEIMTILVMFHFSHYRTLKDFYLNCILIRYKAEFPNAVSYNRFVELEAIAFMPLAVLLLHFPGQKTDRYFVDSTKLAVCHNLRISCHRMFKDIARRGKTSTGWFFGFKLHLVFNHKGELMSFALTPGNVDDRSTVTTMMKSLKGWLAADRGYISKKLASCLEHQGVELITKLKRNMKKVVLEPLKQYFLSKRGMIETIIDQLKNMLYIDHSRHRSVINFQVNILSGLLAYIFKPKKISVPFNIIPQPLPLLMSN